jgi:outer membrane protein OmpA-like peptidoglycan-associated protein
VRCEGYTDYAGARKHELALSRRRAQAVCAALVRDRAGVNTTSLGYGPARPAVVGGSARARRENRRVVVLVTG